MDKAEERAIRRAERFAYEATEGIINSQAQKETYAMVRDFIMTGIRLMREEVELHE